MKTIRWGIIGCGNVCEIKSGPAFYKCKNSVLQAVMRRDGEKAKDFAARHQVPRWYTDAEALIRDPDVDVVYVATPPSTHALYAIQALKAGKPVYVEKPMAMNYEECLEMIKAANETGQKLWVAHYRRGLPYFLKIKELIEMGSIGKVQTVTVSYFRPPGKHDLAGDPNNWRVDKAIAGGGYFYDLAPHTLDILHFLLGKFSQVNGVIQNTAGLYPVEDTISASFRFESGVIGSGIWNFVAPESMRKDLIEITGEKGIIRFSTFLFSQIEWIGENGAEYFDLTPQQPIQQGLVQTIVDEMLGVGKCLSDGETAAHTQWVIDQLFKGA